MHRFFIEAEHIQGDCIQIPVREKRHIEQVLRLRSGDRLVFFDGRGCEYDCVLLPKQEGTLWAQIEHIVAQSRMPDLRLHLCQGLAKGGKMDYVIQKAAELGICTFTPVANQHSVIVLDPQKAERKRRRWQDIAQEACKQCGRNTMLQVEPVCDWETAVSNLSQKNFLVLYEKEREVGLKTILPLWRQEQVQEIHLFVGPEGGYTQAEIDYALRCGGKVAGLGPRILRTETAGLVVAGIIFYEWGELTG